MQTTKGKATLVAFRKRYQFLITVKFLVRVPGSAALHSLNAKKLKQCLVSGPSSTATELVKSIMNSFVTPNTLEIVKWEKSTRWL